MQKKLIFLAGVAIAAMASCTKVEPVQSTASQAQISFQPLSAVQTKASPITKYETNTGDFKVWAWYQSSSVSDTFTPGLIKNYTDYMTGEVCTYKDGNVDDGAGAGAWFPENTYYWPKNGKLTFSAYYPADAVLSVDARNGITVTDYSVSTDNSKQVDLMYSDRVFDKTSSTQTDANQDYDGVDIKFNHALAAVDFSVKTDKDYFDAIKVYEITIENAYSQGDFAEGYTDGTATNKASAAWSNQKTPAEYNVYKGTSAAVKTASAKIGETSILLPQNFSDDIKVTVEYGIKFGIYYLTQTAEFKLKGTHNTTGTEISGWEMGKWYHYTFTFSLDQVYFAPSVENWDEVNVEDLLVK